MHWLCLILLVFSPAILYAGALIGMALKQRYFRRRCPFCGLRALKPVNFILATVVIDGKRAPDRWAYYLCTACNKLLKEHHGGWKEASPAEY